MNHNRRLLWLAAAVVVLLVAVSALTWRSAAAPSAQPPVPVVPERTGGSSAAPGPAVVVAGGPGFYMLSAHLFQPFSSSMPWNYGTGGDLFNPGPGDGYYIGSVSLPHGATVTRLVAYYYDVSGMDMSVQLYRYDGQGTWVKLAGVYSSGSSGYGYAMTESIYDPVIDMQTYSYTVWVYLYEGSGYDLGFSNVRIDYAYGVKVPLVLKDD